MRALALSQLKTPEKTLLAYLLEITLRDAESDCPSLWIDAMEWLLYDGREAWTFFWVCDHLDLCPDAIRQKRIFFS